MHFWDPRAHYYPWLCDPEPIALRYGDYRALRRPYLPADYRADAGGWRILRTVHVEADWDPHDPRVDPLIDELDAWQIEQEDDSDQRGDLTLVSVRVAEASPAWRRILDVLTDRARRRRTALPNN